MQTATLPGWGLGDETVIFKNIPKEHVCSALGGRQGGNSSKMGHYEKPGLPRAGQEASWRRCLDRHPRLDRVPLAIHQPAGHGEASWAAWGDPSQQLSLERRKGPWAENSSGQAALDQKTRLELR